MKQTQFPIRLWPRGLLLIAFVAGLIALVAIWPAWTLRYIDVLAWPLVALLAILTFGPALARRVPSLSALHLPGGVVATFDQQQESLDVDGDYAAELTSPDAWGEVWEGEGADIEPEQDALAIANEGIRILGTIVGAFQIQLDFLRTLVAAENGLSQSAARDWFNDRITNRGLDPEQWDADRLIAWLDNQGAVTLGQDGVYRATPFGERVIQALALPGLYVAPKAV